MTNHFAESADVDVATAPFVMHAAFAAPAPKDTAAAAIAQIKIFEFMLPTSSKKMIPSSPRENY
jgi:hypothetical protein